MRALLLVRLPPGWSTRWTVCCCGPIWTRLGFTGVADWTDSTGRTCCAPAAAVRSASRSPIAGRSTTSDCCAQRCV